MCRSTDPILLFTRGLSSLLVTTFSRARITPSSHFIPMQVLNTMLKSIDKEIQSTLPCIFDGFIRVLRLE